MDLDLRLISAVISGGDDAFVLTRKKGFDASYLKGPAVKFWEFIEHHVIEHGAVPSEKYFTSKLQVDLVEAEDEVTVYLEELRQRALWTRLSGSHDKIGQLLEQRRIDDAYAEFSNAMRGARADRLVGVEVESLLMYGEQVIEYYDKIKSGERGVLSPWEKMNDMTLGFWPGDFVVLCARLGVGKTFFLLLLARHAWMNGKKVLFIGTEMSNIRLALRFYSIHFKLPYDDLRKGKLDDFQENRMREEITKILSAEGLHIMGQGFNSSMSGIEAAIDDVKPDIVFIDGLYLVKNRGKDRYEMVSNTADDCKILARTRGIPVVATHQLNRGVEQDDDGSSISAGNLGITDVIGWNADVLFALWQTFSMKDDGLMGVRPLKLREGEGKGFMSNWDFRVMDFSQMKTKEFEESEFKVAEEGDYDSEHMGADTFEGSDDDFIY